MSYSCGHKPWMNQACIECRPDLFNHGMVGPGPVALVQMGPSALAKDARIKDLENAIRKHREQKGDDRCWMDDEELYSILPEGLGDADIRLCAPDEMLECCKKFIATRHDPSKDYISPQRRIEELEARVQSLQRDLKNDGDDDDPITS